MEEFYWPSIGIVTGGIVLAGFAMGVFRRDWNGTALYVALGCMVVALLHMVAPFRGTLDPDYVGYSFGLISLERGPLVGIVAGIVYIVSTAAMVTALRNRDGPAMWLVAALSVHVLAIQGGYLLAGLIGLVPPFRLELGEYLQLSPLPATALAAVVILLPFAVGLRWSVTKARAPHRAAPAWTD